MESNSQNPKSDQMGNNNNMPPSNLTTGGIDWLELSVFVDLGKVFEEDLGEQFRSALEEAKETSAEQVVHCFEDKSFAVQSYGPRMGGFSYPIRAVDELGVVWMFRDKPIDHKTIPAVYVRIPGEICLCSDYSVKELVCHIQEFFDKLSVYGGAPVRKIAVSRVDYCVDLPGVSVEQFKNAHFKRHYVSKARSEGAEIGLGGVDKETWRYMQSKGLTLYYGRSPLCLRVYDKLAELDHKLNPAKLDAMIKRRWGGQTPYAATRVEFEVRREALKKRGIDTVEDLFSKESALVDYLSFDWFRYTSRSPVGVKHPRELPLLKVWKRARTGFLKIFEPGTDSSSDLSPLEKSDVDVSALSKQVMGVLLKMAEVQGIDFNDFGEFMNYSAKSLQGVAKSKRPEWFETHNFDGGSL